LLLVVVVAVVVVVVVKVRYDVISPFSFALLATCVEINGCEVESALTNSSLGTVVTQTKKRREGKG